MTCVAFDNEVMASPGALVRRKNGVSATTEVVAYDRARDAHRLRLGGLDWETIAERTGYAGGRIARLAVNGYLEKAAVEQAPEQRQRDLELEVARLDALGAPYWEPALNGNLPAALFVLKLSAQRTALLGLDKIAEAGPVQDYIVIGGSTEEYTAGLKAVVEQEERERTESSRSAGPSW